MKRFQDIVARVLRNAALGAILLIVIAPILLTVTLSFDERDFLGPLPPTGFSLHWYKAFFGSPFYMHGAAVSLMVAAVAVAISTTCGVMTALFLSGRRFAGREALLSFFLSPLIVPNIVVGFAILMAFTFYGIGDAFTRLVAGHTLLIMPFTIRTTLVTLEGVRKSLTEAALTLGARPWSVFWEVTFPLVRPGIVAGAVFATSVSLQETAASIFLTDDRVYTLSVALLSQMRANFDLTIAAAAGVYVLGVGITVLLLDRLIGLDRITGRGAYSQH